MEFDNLKRALDEATYENENLRRTVQAKQEEIISLNNHLALEQVNNADLQRKCEELQGVIADLESKNKKLIDLLNATIYSKAEKYKEKVLNRL